MSADRLGDMLAAHFRNEHAITAARRFISRSIASSISRSDVAAFLRKRRDKLSDADVDYCSIEAMERWLHSKANRYRGPRS